MRERRENRLGFAKMPSIEARSEYWPGYKLLKVNAQSIRYCSVW